MPSFNCRLFDLTDFACQARSNPFLFFRIRARLWCKVSPNCGVWYQGRPWDDMRYFDLASHDANFDLDHGAGLVYGTSRFSIWPD